MQALIASFSFDNLNVRTFADEQGRPWFCASDVCKALGYALPQKATRDHCKPEGITKRNTPTSGGMQTLLFINERNLYRLIMRSKLESAERFQDWVEGEVLPAIRKTGNYGAAASLPDYPTTLRLYAEQLERTALLERQAQENAPKVAFADDFLKTDGDFLIRQTAKALDVGVMWLFDFMRTHRMIMKTNEPYAEFCARGILRPRPSRYQTRDGEQRTTLTTHVTPKGIYYLHDRLIKIGVLTPDHQINFDHLRPTAKQGAAA